MTPPRSKTPIESFGPELMAAILAGSRRKVIITFPEPNGVGRKKAHRFQLRINTLRSRMREEHHIHAPLAMRARVGIRWGARAVAEGAPAAWRDDHSGVLGAIIVIQPQDAEFSDALTRAGIGGDTPPNPANPTQEPPPPAEEPSSYDDLLSELIPKKDP